MSRIVIKFFELEDGTCPLLEWIDSIKPKKARAKVLGRIALLEDLGQDIRRPHADYLRPS